MYSFVNSSLGWFHLASAALALIAGSLVLATRKGTRSHKEIGYLYLASMLLVCGSALGIYRLTGGFGMFHVAAVTGLLTLVGGMMPMFVSRWKKYRAVHLWFMYYSVLGLYAALFSELSVRIPARPFYEMVGIATGLVFLAGTLFILKKEKIWSRYFA